MEHLSGKKTYTVEIDFHAIKLPPVSDILILAKKYPQGKHGVMEAFKFIAPDEFEMFEIPEDEIIEAVLINKKILQRLSSDRIIDILRSDVFPYVAKGEAIKVNFTVHMSLSKVIKDV